jgi:hypothetical protein
MHKANWILNVIKRAEKEMPKEIKKAEVIPEISEVKDEPYICARCGSELGIKREDGIVLCDVCNKVEEAENPEDKKAIEQHYSPENKDIDVYDADADDLVLLVENEEPLYGRLYGRLMDMYKNLTRKKLRGVYDVALAPKLFMYLVEEVAKLWFQRITDWADDGKSQVNKPTREVKQQAAEELARRFEEAFTSKEYDFMTELEKKYKARGIGKKDVQKEVIPEVKKEENLNKKSGATKPFDVYLYNKLIDTVFYSGEGESDIEDIKNDLIDHDGYDPNIVVKEGKLDKKADDSDDVLHELDKVLNQPATPKTEQTTEVKPKVAPDKVIKPTKLDVQKIRLQQVTAQDVKDAQDVTTGELKNLLEKTIALGKMMQNDDKMVKDAIDQLKTKMEKEQGKSQKVTVMINAAGKLFNTLNVYEKWVARVGKDIFAKLTTRTEKKEFVYPEDTKESILKNVKEMEDKKAQAVKELTAEMDKKILDYQTSMAKEIKTLITEDVRLVTFPDLKSSLTIEAVFADTIKNLLHSLLDWGKGLVGFERELKKI